MPGCRLSKARHFPMRLLYSFTLSSNSAIPFLIWFEVTIQAGHTGPRISVTLRIVLSLFISIFRSKTLHWVVVSGIK